LGYDVKAQEFLTKTVQEDLVKLKFPFLIFIKVAFRASLLNIFFQISRKSRISWAMRRWEKWSWGGKKLENLNYG